jgi:DNA mismatch repair protein PMS2
MIIEEHTDVFNNNGFTFSWTTDELGKKLFSLTGLPLSKTKTFGVAGTRCSCKLANTFDPTFTDFEELVHLVGEFPENKNVMCSSVLAMFASRACRTSTMIGTPLSFQQMTTVLD